jgi:hypothetical protein
MLSAPALSLFAPSLAHADDVTITPEARARFSAGVNLLKDPEGPRYEEAYREFKAAYASSPSYKILGNLGLCAMKLERDEEAIQAFEKYLTHAKDLEPAEVAQVKTDLETLKSGVVHVTVASDPPGAKLIDVRLPVRGERVTNIYGPIAQSQKLGIRQGSHQITAKLDGYVDAVWEFDAGSAEIPPHTFTLKKVESGAVAANPAPTPANPTTVAPVQSAPETPVATSRPIPTGVYIGAAATGALAAGAVVTGILALGKHSDFQTQNTGTDPSTAQSTKDAGQTLNLVTDICIGGAVVAAAVTTYFFVSRPSVTEPRPAVSELRLAPFAGARSGGLSFGGKF